MDVRHFNGSPRRPAAARTTERVDRLSDMDTDFGVLDPGFESVGVTTDFEVAPGVMAHLALGQSASDYRLERTGELA